MMTSIWDDCWSNSRAPHVWDTSKFSAIFVSLLLQKCVVNVGDPGTKIIVPVLSKPFTEVGLKSVFDSNAKLFDSNDFQYVPCMNIFCHFVERRD